MDATRAFAERIGFPRQTFYGTMWDTQMPVRRVFTHTHTLGHLRPHAHHCPRPGA